MTATPARMSKSAIDSLARLLAVENISIQHQPVPTAAFDTLNRTLILPIWEDMSQDVYDMLVGHEVGHALFTPAGEQFITDALKRIKDECGANQGLAKSTLNIVEDARIERMMKDKYPGLRRNFVRGYGWLNGRDFFEIDGKDIAELSILDRINLHYKLGTINISIPFNAIEKVFIQKIDAMETFTDVIDVSIEILKFYKDNRKEEIEQQDAGQPAPGGQGDDNQDDQQQNQSGAGDDGFDDDETDTEDGDDSASGAGDAASDDGEDVGDDNGDESGDESGEDSGASMEDDTDDGESADSEDAGCKQTSDASGTDKNGQVDEGGWGNEKDTTTNDSLESSLEKNTNQDENLKRAYVKNPSLIMENIIVTHKEITEIWDNHASIKWDAADRYRKMWERTNMPVINNMAKQFEMKKAADESRRTMTTKTGRLDMNRLHAYKTSDDIFLSNSMVQDGQNHGLVMFIDWSGSMSGNLAGTISQLLNLVYFCKKSNIPFEVYAFTSVCSDYSYNMSDEQEAECEKLRNLPMNRDDDDLTVDKFRLLQFFNSNTMSNNQFRRAVQQMMALMLCNMGPCECETYFGSDFDGVQDLSTEKNGCSYNMIPRRLQLGSTPLNECIIAAKDIVTKFKTQNNVQICNTVFLTDGESSGRFYRRNSNSYGEVIVMSHGRKEFELKGNDTNALLRWLEASTNCHVMGFFICSWQEYRRYIGYGYFGQIDWEQQAAKVKEYKRNGFDIVPSHPGYDEFYAINMAPTTSKAIGFDDLDSDASLTKIKNAFMKSGNTKKSNRKIMVRFAEIFATNKV